MVRKRETQNIPGVRVTENTDHGKEHCGWSPCPRVAGMSLVRPAEFWRETGVTHHRDRAFLCHEHYMAIINYETERDWPKLAERFSIPVALKGYARAMAVAKATGQSSLLPRRARVPGEDDA